MQWPEPTGLRSCRPLGCRVSVLVALALRWAPAYSCCRLQRSSSPATAADGSGCARSDAGHDAVLSQLRSREGLHLARIAARSVGVLPRPRKGMRVAVLRIRDGDHLLHVRRYAHQLRHLRVFVSDLLPCFSVGRSGSSFSEAGPVTVAISPFFFSSVLRCIFRGAPPQSGTLGLVIVGRGLRSCGWGGSGVTGARCRACGRRGCVVARAATHCRPIGIVGLSAGGSCLLRRSRRSGLRSSDLCSCPRRRSWLCRSYSRSAACLDLRLRS